MKRLEAGVPGLSIEAFFPEAGEGVTPLGVRVVFHPGISNYMRNIVLESALRLWQREVGAVTRGAAPEALGADLWLKGWTIQPFAEEPITQMLLAYYDADEEKEKTA